jgi:hypothetical protein
MSRLTAAGRRLATEAIAKALCGGTYVNYDGDGRELVRCTMPDAFKMVTDTCFKFEALTQGRCTNGGMAAMFAVFPPGDTARTEPLIGGTIGRALGKYVHAAMDDQQLHVGMLFDVDEFSYTMQFPEME